ncbi:MAG: hypothetical protein P8M50_03830 [Paracoccaceae bacterium]|nr:hypothetical protein [Paracoccaceae bacterium]
MQNLILNRTKDIEIAVSELVKKEPKFLKAVSVCGLPKMRKGNTGFEGLLKIIVGQQISIAAANSIWKKLIDSNLTQIKSFSVVDESVLRDLGMSKKKFLMGKDWHWQRLIMICFWTNQILT